MPDRPPTRCIGANGYPCPLHAKVPGGERPRCAACQQAHKLADLDRRRERRTSAEIKRARATVRAWIETHGMLCPGVPSLDRPPHPARELSADHLQEVSAGGSEHGPLGVLCPSCQTAKWRASGWGFG
jgi:hypothetical protein